MRPDTVADILLEAAMGEYVLYHNPRCSKSRAALELLQSRGAAPHVVPYLDTPPDAATLRAIVDALGVPARALLRSGEDEYTALGLGDPALDDARAIAAMVAYPDLIERPILVHGNRAVIGRPPERVLELVDPQGPGAAEPRVPSRDPQPGA